MAAPAVTTTAPSLARESDTPIAKVNFQVIVGVANFGGFYFIKGSAQIFETSAKVHSFFSHYDLALSEADRSRYDPTFVSGDEGKIYIRHLMMQVADPGNGSPSREPIPIFPNVTSMIFRVQTNLAVDQDFDKNAKWLKTTLACKLFPNFKNDATPIDRSRVITLHNLVG